MWTAPLSAVSSATTRACYPLARCYSSATTDTTSGQSLGISDGASVMIIATFNSSSLASVASAMSQTRRCRVGVAEPFRLIADHYEAIPITPHVLVL
jgi:hypothetical protein